MQFFQQNMPPTEMWLTHYIAYLKWIKNRSTEGHKTGHDVKVRKWLTETHVIGELKIIGQTSFQELGMASRERGYIFEVFIVGR